MAHCVLFTASTWSHIVNFHRPYLQAFRNLGWQVHVAAGGEAPPLSEADRTIPLPFEKKMTAPSNFRAQAQLRQLMKAQSYDLVCTHTSLAAFFTRRAAAGLGQQRPPVVNVAHGYLFDDQTPALKRTVLLVAERLTAPQTDLLLTMNQWDDDMARRQHLGRRFQCIPGVGVDFSRLRTVSPAETGALRSSLGLAKGDFALVYAAEFSNRKNQAMLLRALPLLPERVKLLLPGTGALLSQCQVLAETLGVAHRVVFPGQITDMPLWYQAADAAVSSSRSEGLPFNIMESMYYGLPVVASQVKGHTDLIQSKQTGYLYPFDDEIAFAAYIQHLLDDPLEAAAMGAAARDAVTPYGLERVLPLVMDAYCSVLNT